MVQSVNAIDNASFPVVSKRPQAQVGQAFFWRRTEGLYAENKAGWKISYI